MRIWGKTAKKANLEVGLLSGARQDSEYLKTNAPPSGTGFSARRQCRVTNLARMQRAVMVFRILDI